MAQDSFSLLARVLKLVAFLFVVGINQLHTLAYRIREYVQGGRVSLVVGFVPHHDHQPHTTTTTANSQQHPPHIHSTLPPSQGLGWLGLCCLCAVQSNIHAHIVIVSRPAFFRFPCR